MLNRFCEWCVFAYDVKTWFVVARSWHPLFALGCRLHEANSFFAPLRRAGYHPFGFSYRLCRVIIARSWARLANVLLRYLPGLFLLGFLAHVRSAIIRLDLNVLSIGLFVLAHGWDSLCQLLCVICKVTVLVLPV